MKRNNHFWQSGVYLFFIFCFGFLKCSIEYITGGETVNEMVSLYLPDGSPAKNAVIEFYTVGDTSKQYVYQTVANEIGQYSLAGVTSSNGRFNIWGQLGDSLMAIQDSVFISATTHNAKNDTLGKPGSITGIVGLQPNDDPRTVTVQAVGTHLYKNVDYQGRFTLDGMAAGKYILRISTTLAEYTDTFAHVIAKSDVADTLADTLWLIYTGIPVVTGSIASYDTLTGVTHLFWNKTIFPNFQDYLIYRDHYDSINLSLDPIASALDTFYNDSIFDMANPLSNDFRYKYRIKIRDKTQVIGKSFGFLDVLAASPLKVKTTNSYQIINKANGLLADTLTPNDPAYIVSRFYNETRPYRTVTWSLNHPDSIIRERLLDSTMTEGTDTLTYTWPSEGNFKVYTMIEDLAGAIWLDSITVPIWEYPSPVQLFIDSIFGYSTYLRWTKSTEGNFKSYQLFYSHTPISLGNNLDTVIFEITDTTLYLTDLVSDTTYYFQIAVIDSSNLSKTSNELEDSTLTLWSTKASIPASYVCFSSSCAINNKIYVTGNMYYNYNYEYDVGTNTWATKSPPISFRGNATSSTINDKMYVLGGRDTSQMVVTINEEYDPSIDAWRIRAPMPTARYYLTSNAVNGKIYVIGGFDSSGNKTDAVEEYDPVQDTWTTKKPIPTAGLYPVSCVHNEKIYVVTRNGEVWAYNPTNDTWDSKAPLPVNPQHFNYINVNVVNNKIYAFGLSNSATHSFFLYEYSSETLVWKSKYPVYLSKKYSQLCYFTSASYKDNIFIIGGVQSLSLPTGVTDVTVYSVSK